MIWRLPVSVIFLSLIPSVIISILILTHNKNEGLNTPFFLKLMILGAASVLPGVFLVSLAIDFLPVDLIGIFFLKPFIAVALIEEFLKLLIFIVIIYRNKHFRTVKQGIFYGVAIAIGFAFAENIFYLTGAPGGLPLILTRSLTAVPMHSLCGAIMGFYSGIGKTQEKKYRAKSLFFPVLLHGMYNNIVNMSFPYYLLSIILIILSLIFLKHQYRKSESLNPFKDT